MKVLPFTIPVSFDKSIIVQDDILPYFYPHLHRHEEIQLTMILQGEGTLLVGNNMHPFNAGEIYLIGANMPHVFKSNPAYFAPGSSQVIQAVTIFFNTKGKLAPVFSLPEMKNICTFFESFHSGIKIPSANFEEISGKVSLVRKLSGIDQLTHFLMLLKSLSLLENTDTASANVQPGQISDFEGMRISRIYNYILQHFNRDLALEEVAAAAYMTPQAFCRYFKKHTRLTFVSFLNEVRINEARKRLLEGAYESVSSIAYECGFNSITNFNRVFKMTTGKSPREYVSNYMQVVN